MTEPVPAGTTAPPASLTVRPAVLWSAVVLVLAAVAVAVLVPWVRHQVAESVRRAPEPYSALAFADPAAPLDCATGTAVVTLANGTRARRTYAYTLTLTPSGSAAPVRTVRGQVAVAAGAEARLTVGPGRALPAGTRLGVTLDGGQEIVAACTGAGS